MRGTGDEMRDARIPARVKKMEGTDGGGAGTLELGRLGNFFKKGRMNRKRAGREWL